MKPQYECLTVTGWGLYPVYHEGTQVTPTLKQGSCDYHNPSTRKIEGTTLKGFFELGSKDYFQLGGISYVQKGLH